MHMKGGVESGRSGENLRARKLDSVFVPDFGGAALLKQKLRDIVPSNHNT